MRPNLNHPIGKRLREDAALFCQARANIACWPASDDTVRATLGVSWQAGSLALYAWRYVMNSLNWPGDYVEDSYWAEAESLLRSGWSPRYWRGE